MPQFRFAGESRSERYDTVHGAGIGPAADDQRLALLISGRPAVNVHQSNDHRIVCRNVERRLMLALDDTQIIRRDDRGDPVVDLVILCGDRVSDIDGQTDRAGIQIDHADVPDQRSGLFILHSAADPFAVQVKTDVIVVEPDELGHIVAGEVQITENVHQDRDRVLALFRFGTVGALSGDADLQAFADPLEVDLPSRGLAQGGEHAFDVVIVAAIVPVDDRPGAVRDRICRRSAPD